MTDSTPNVLDGLIATYEAGVTTPGEAVTAWLDARSQIEAQSAELTDAQLQRVENADKKLIQNAEQVLPRIPEGQRSAHPANEWWWHLDVLAPVSDYFSAPKPSGNSQLLSRLFTAAEVIVLIVAVGLLARNLGLFQPGAPPTSTPLPTSTPTVPPTVNAAAFNMSSAKAFTSPDKVIQIQVPDGWTEPAGQAPYTYVFVYGDPQAPTVFMQIKVQNADEFYSTMDATGQANSITSALNALIKANTSATPTGQGPTFGPITPVKIGTLDGQGILVSTQASAQGPAGQFDIRAAAVPNSNKVVFVQGYGDATDWPQAQPILAQMVNSLVVTTQNIPTATPTATLHPLLLTATAVQNQIIALTPTSTPVGTAAATGAATSAVLPNGTAAATANGAPGVVGSVVTTADGLQYVDTVIGTGATAVAGKTVRVHYTGKLANGSIFDTTTGKTPDYFEFVLGQGNVIKGWDEGVAGMKVGGKRTLTIPPALGYGAAGSSGVIPPNATLVFDIELLAVN